MQIMLTNNNEVDDKANILFYRKEQNLQGQVN